MNNDLNNLINSGEDETTEFKTSFGKAVVDTLVAFANAKGGKILIGVKNDGEIIGVNLNNESVQNWVNEIKTKTEPSLVPVAEIIDVSNKKVVIFIVQEYPIKPVSTKGKYLKRVANSNHLMSIDEISNEHLRTLNSSWDYFVDPYHSIDNMSIEKINLFFQKTGLFAELSINNIEKLSKLEVIRSGKLTLGGYLLFNDDYCLISDVQVGRFKSPTTIIDSVSLNTDLFTEVDEILSFVKKHLMVEYIITGEARRTERFDYPFEAIREIVINMVVHRDYRDSSASIIKIFDDRIEFYNPGKLYGDIKIEDLLSGNYISKSRNKLIAKLFKEVGLIERYGSGIMRIMKICDEYGVMSPKFEEHCSGFRVTLYKAKNSELGNVPGNVPENVPGNAPENVFQHRISEIIKLIQENSQISMREMSIKLNVNIKTVKRDLQKLKQAGLLKRVGPDKGGHWEVITKDG